MILRACAQTLYSAPRRCILVGLPPDRRARDRRGERILPIGKVLRHGRDDSGANA